MNEQNSKEDYSIFVKILSFIFKPIFGGDKLYNGINTIVHKARYPCYPFAPTDKNNI